MSRQGKEFHNVDHITKQIDEIKNIDKYLVDGELVGDDWSHTITMSRTFKTTPLGTIRYKVFDFVRLDQVNERLIDRRERFAEILGCGNFSNISLTPCHIVSSYKEFRVAFDEYTSSGCDGAMIKDVHGSYEFKRSKHWLKVKPYSELDCQIVGFNIGKGKYDKTLGSIDVCIPIEGHKWSTFSTSVSGMDDKDRGWIWKNRSNLKGKLIEVQFRKISDKSRLIEPRVSNPLKIQDIR